MIGHERLAAVVHREMVPESLTNLFPRQTSLAPGNNLKTICRKGGFFSRSTF